MPPLSVLPTHDLLPFFQTVTLPQFLGTLTKLLIIPNPVTGDIIQMYAEENVEGKKLAM